MGTTTQTTAGSAAKRAMDVPVGIFRAVEGNLFGGLGDCGAEIIQRLQDDAQYRQRVQQAMLLDGYCEPPDHGDARNVFGERFWGLPEWKKYFGLDLSDIFPHVPAFSWRGGCLSSVDCPLREGKCVTDNFFAFLGLSSMDDVGLDVFKWKDKILEFEGEKAPFIEIDTSAQAMLSRSSPELALHWYVASIDPVPMSHNRAMEAQETLLPKEIPLPDSFGGSLGLRVTEMMEYLTSRLLMNLKGIPFRKDVVARCRDWYVTPSTGPYFSVEWTHNNEIKISTRTAEHAHERCVVFANLEPPNSLRIRDEYSDNRP